MGDAARDELVRVQRALAGDGLDEGARATLARRRDTLIADNRERWLGPWVHGDAKVVFEDGFAAEVTLGRTGVAADALRDLVSSPDATHIRRFECYRATDDDVAMLARLPRLAAAHLLHATVTDAGLGHLAGLAALRTVDLTRSRLDGLEAVARIETLRDLDLLQARVGDDDLAPLGRLPDLRWLCLIDTDVGDAGLVHIGRIASLQSLHLGVTRITDAGLAHLGALGALEWLSLMDTCAGDDGMRHLRALSSLRELHVDGTLVTDAGLEHLARMPWLERIHLLSLPRVTAEGIARLGAALPGCQLVHRT